MALPTALPFGLRDVKLWALDATGTRSGSGVDLPVSRTFSFSEVEDFEELEGDDTTVASHGAGPKVEWELEAGGISLDAYKIIAGGAVVTTGSGASEKKTYTKLRTDSRPYFEVEGQAISDSGGDLHCVVYRCKADGDLEGSFENGSFSMTKCKGKGYGSTSTGKLYEFIQNASETAIVP